MKEIYVVGKTITRNGRKTAIWPVANFIDLSLHLISGQKVTISIGCATSDSNLESYLLVIVTYLHFDVFIRVDMVGTIHDDLLPQ